MKFVVVEKGICRGFEMALKLKTPGEVVEANAGFDAELTVVNIGENTIEEELAWGVDSTVHVPPFCETVAELIILEDHKARLVSHFIILYNVFVVHTLADTLFVTID